MPAMDKPWLRWVPGVLNAAQVRDLIAGGYLRAEPSKCGASALDLSLGTDAWSLVDGAVKPDGPGYLLHLQRDNLVESCSHDGDGAVLLQRGRTYLIRLAPAFAYMPALAEAQVHGQATAKSTIGRLDVLVRFILDGMNGYENFGPEELKAGDGAMFIEVTPLSFPIRVKAGQALSQLRLFYGQPEDVEIRGDLLWRTVVRGREGAAHDRMLSVSLDPDRVGTLEALAFATREDAPEAPLDTWMRETYEPWQYWRLIAPHPSERQRVHLQPGRFYILRSQEQLWLPRGVAAYCRATDESIGEMRIHYAGFVHPGFGFERKDGGRGTPLIFEVRGHDFHANLLHGEKMARLQFYRMSQEAEPDDDTYQLQQLKLSALFKPWPGRLRHLDAGIVEPDLPPEEQPHEP